MRKVFISLSIVFAIIAALSIAPVFAEGSDYKCIEDSMPRVIVEGVGKVTAKPDEAIIRLGIVNEEKSLKKAFQHQTEDMNKVINEIKSLGIQDEDIKTISYNITPKVKEGPIWWGKRKPESFEVSHMLSVKIKDLSKIGDVIDTVVNAGAISINGLEFKSSKIEELEKDARLKAAKNAKEKAEVIAEGAGFKVGKVLKASEAMGGHFPVYRERYAKTAVMEAASAAPEIEPGSIELEATCTIIYEITQRK
ncbi:MAG: hypothetical protein COS99_03795 [Candidatus Omnitrophica bacterium CG07_land_8_20_14_0_80_42_15]|uniref:SIMPL domain-containing protein n=1 Tax=Candidatus Aquitaenariimonas noxiae TaxID=1974741 RepID=A0A2J0L0X3_9BACT|nr:MAG: hypothetical protein COS99_03795 [Candidatus Omnitrophica bacterium CG07_land_8_20_14_0_80_42_15]